MTWKETKNILYKWSLIFPLYSNLISKIVAGIREVENCNQKILNIQQHSNKKT